jgi:HSP90 family molecular chaperone
MAKLRNFLTKRVIKLIKDEAEKQPEEYVKWFKNFAIFIKEGSLDPEFRKDMVDLNRYEVNTEEGYFSLKDYVAKKRNTQDVIFYATAPSRAAAVDNPYIYPLTKNGIPVLITNTPVEEFIFHEMETYEGLKFANVENATADMERVLKGVKEQDKEAGKEEKEQGAVVPADDITAFSLWIKNELQPYVTKVVVSTKDLLGPALVISPITSGMRQMAFMRNLMEEQAKSGKPRA